MQKLLTVIILFVLLINCKTKQDNAAATIKVEASQSDWQSLFNGQDFEGWNIKCSPSDKNLQYWNVVDGAIVANSMGSKDHGYIWLVTDQEFSDFELRLKFQSYRDSPGNSGVQIRSRYDAKGMVKGEKDLGYMDGPQVDIHPPGAWRTGYIYDETRGHRRWIDPSLPDWNMDKEIYEPEHHLHYFSDEAPHWNELTIICNGNNIKTIVNGIQVSDYDGKGILDDKHHQKVWIVEKGCIALQLHKNDELKIAFKDIRLKKLLH